MPLYDTLSPEQASVVDAVREGRNIFLTGGGGTGKTHLCNAIKEDIGSKLVVTASTGIAAVNCCGSTIHSFTGVVDFKSRLEYIVDRIEKNQSVVERIQNCEHLLIDEISMIDGRYLDVLDAVFKKVKGRGSPMGGVQLILVGDFLQLPPVSRDGSPVFAFESNLWTEADFVSFSLKKTFRQSEEQTIRALRHVRVGKVSDKVVRFFQTRVNALDTTPDVDPVVLESRNVDVDAYNEKRLLSLKSPIRTYSASCAGEEPYLSNLIKNCLAPEELRLCKGAQVMLLKNLDTASGLINGSIGKVVGFKNCGSPIIRFQNGISRTFDDTANWSTSLKGKKVACFDQIPLRLAWSVTIHKSQGLTLDKVRISLRNCFAQGQAYVALSRARSIDSIFLDDFKPSFVKTNPRAYKFYEDLYLRSQRS